MVNDGGTQVVSATPVCLLKLVEEGSFDAALYYALNVMYFELFE
jgi:transcriptional regulator of acetoin/glycerol metabolism